MSNITSAPDSSEDSSAADPRPAGQRERAANAHLNPNDPAKDAEAGTPNYGNFGKADETEPAVPKSSQNDGSNDNPDEFSEFRSTDNVETENTATDVQDANLMQQRGHVTQNQDPQAVRAAQNADADAQTTAWAEDDPRYAGGHAKASWTEENSKEHNND